jgi:putative oxidoreductase
LATGKITIDEAGTIDKSRLIIPGLAGLYQRVAPLSYAFLRIMFALIFLPAGIDKMFWGGATRIAVGNVAKLSLKPELAWAWTVAGLEFFGAILLALGLFTRPLAFAFAVELVVIAFGIMSARGFFYISGGMEVALLLEALAIAFVFSGGGRYSLDRLIGREF